ncbi:recombinase family protein [Rhodocyclus tenuis]|uniref:recombinase family protein n=1 Tax=Rhodocyclus tenuis TaxID=1066 RepID=UPI003B8A66B8
MHVALYARVSTTRQADNDLSIPDQLRQLREWCAANGHTAIREYVEPGASATDDKRPVFQQMIGDAMDKPPAFEAIIVHSLSRFFLDLIEFGVYEKRLKRNGVKIVSITQQTSEDSAGEMARRLFSLFDEYQSKENAKHTSRAMCENARQGFYNGSKAPFGYRTIQTDISGSRGRKKKRLDVDPAEALIVRDIYDLYLYGHAGRTFGIKEIVKHLTQRGHTMRGAPWSIQKVQKILSSPAYIGEHNFNVINSKTGQKRPQSEWITVKAEPIIAREQFARVAALREARSPKNTPPRVVSSPTLLTGLLKCACGHAVTLVTGKSGRYRYYKCSNRQSKGNHACQSRNFPEDKLDRLIIEQLADRVCAPDRLHELITELRKRTRDTKDAEQHKINELNRLLKKAEAAQRNLYAAIENGLPFDETLQKRAQELKAERESLMIELAGVRRTHALPVERILPSNIEAFSKAIRAKLADKAFAKRYLQALVDEIVVSGDTATMRGSYAALANAVAQMKKGTSEEVPRFMFDWRARSDSNARPLGS